MQEDSLLKRINKGFDYSVSDARIIKFGRYEIKNEGLLTTWSGFTLRFSFRGTGCEIGLKGSGIMFDVFVDGEKTVITTTGNKEKYSIASGLRDSMHDVIIGRRTHCLAGPVTFTGIAAGRGNSFELIKSAVSSKLYVEIIGDSIAAGCFAEGQSNSLVIGASDNGYMSFGPMAARLLGAGWSNVAIGGKGLCRNYLENKPYEDPHMREYYNGMNYPQISGYRSTYRRADFVIVELGTNDFGHPDQPSLLMYAALYSKFLRTILRRHKGAHVICVASFIPNSDFDICRRAISAAAAALADRKVHFTDPVAEGWFTGELYKTCFPDGVHPNQKGHSVIAEKLAALMRQITEKQKVGG